ncbi:MAG TPA: ATP-binding protein [Edaphobacter sp.]|jgi:serine/threonine-protein kinase RsbW|nr:ATP-binding protein [Edaphobacter sp.]
MLKPQHQPVERTLPPDLHGEKLLEKTSRPTLTFEESASTLPSSLLSEEVDDRRVDSAGNALADSTTSRVSFTLDSSLDSVNKVELTAEQVAQRAGFDEDTATHVAMAVREAAVNAVLHGNAYDPSKHMTASFETTSDSLIIRVSDQGPGLDPDSIPDPLAPENILRGSGRGIFLIRAFMDEVHFRQLHPGTELTLIKHRQPAQPGN